MFLTGIEIKNGGLRGQFILGLDFDKLMFIDGTSNQDIISDDSTKEIYTRVKSKTLIFDDSNSQIRLRNQFLNYKKLDDQAVYVYYRDTVDQTAVTGDIINAEKLRDYKSLKFDSDSMVNSLKRINKLQISSEGFGLDELNNVKLNFRVINRGRRATK